MIFETREAAIERIEYILKNYTRLRDHYFRKMQYYKNALNDFGEFADAAGNPGSRADDSRTDNRRIDGSRIDESRIDGSGRFVQLMRTLAVDWCFTEAVWHAGEELTEPDEYEIFCSLYINRFSWCQIQIDTGRNPNTINRIRRKAVRSILRMLGECGIVHIRGQSSES